ncbi:hypothetical protein HDV01_005513 [Terramyces sp. JEL0728]|nr:hypothetical protein HDV01_005513 [Terramyces sp. JEL0728]
MFWSKNTTQKPEYEGANSKVFENPWYPLSGPPQTEEENKMLTEYIQNEKKQLNLALMQKQSFNQSQSKLLKEVAQSNCADIEYEYSICLTTFNLKRFTTMCSSENDRLKECIG